VVTPCRCTVAFVRGTAVSPANVTITVKGLYLPDGVDTYQWKGQTVMVLANEGDYREDNVDRSAATSFGATGTVFAPRIEQRLEAVRHPLSMSQRRLTQTDDT